MLTKVLIGLVLCTSLVIAQEEALGPNGQPKPEPYSFNYATDTEGSSSSHSETGDANGRVTGVYTINGPDGRQRIVEYVADAGGYRATIKTNELGAKPTETGDARFIVSEPSREQLEAAARPTSQPQQQINADSASASGSRVPAPGQQQEQIPASANQSPFAVAPPEVQQPQQQQQQYLTNTDEIPDSPPQQQQIQQQQQFIQAPISPFIPVGPIPQPQFRPVAPQQLIRQQPLAIQQQPFFQQEQKQIQYEQPQLAPGPQPLPSPQFIPAPQPLPAPAFIPVPQPGPGPIEIVQQPAAPIGAGPIVNNFKSIAPQAPVAPIQEIPIPIQEVQQQQSNSNDSSDNGDAEQEKNNNQQQQTSADDAGSNTGSTSGSNESGPTRGQEQQNIVQQQANLQLPEPVFVPINPAVPSAPAPLAPAPLAPAPIFPGPAPVPQTPTQPLVIVPQIQVQRAQIKGGNVKGGSAVAAPAVGPVLPAPQAPEAVQQQDEINVPIFQSERITPIQPAQIQLIAPQLQLAPIGSPQPVRNIAINLSPGKTGVRLTAAPLASIKSQQQSQEQVSSTAGPSSSGSESTSELPASTNSGSNGQAAKGNLEIISLNNNSPQPQEKPASGSNSGSSSGSTTGQVGNQAGTPAGIQQIKGANRLVFGKTRANPASATKSSSLPQPSSPTQTQGASKSAPTNQFISFGTRLQPTKN